MTIGQKILNLRKARAWSQEELADRIGVTRQAVSRWESDSAKPDAEKIVGLCQLFGISADYLLGLDTPKAEAPKEPPKILYVNENRPLVDAKMAGWLLIGVSVLLMIAYFILEEVFRAHMYWLFWVGGGGVFAGICLAPGAKFCAVKTYRRRLGWALAGLSFLPVLIWVGFFGLLYGDWEMEIVWPSITVFLPGLILLWSGKER